MLFLNAWIKLAQQQPGAKKIPVSGYVRRKDGKAGYVSPHWRSMEQGPYSPITKPIPVVENETWEFSIQEHHARNRHFDLRLGDRLGDAHSWALRTLPEPGKAAQAFQTFTHKGDYMNFQGRLEGGYGKGDVFLRERSRALVHYSGPDRLVFSVMRGKSSGDYGLVRIGEKSWILHNMAPPPADIPRGKPTYKELPFHARLLEHADTILAAKLDGAHSVVLLRPGRRIRAFSYRESVTGDPLEYTHKIPGLYRDKAKIVGETVAVGEALAVDAAGKALPAEKTGGFLNAGILRSLGDQATAGAELQLFLFDVRKYDGKDVTQLPYAERLEMLRILVQKHPSLKLAPVAVTSEEKKTLFQAIQEGRHPLTDEGVILWTPKGPVKAKKKQEADVYVREIFPGEGRLRGNAAGGFSYSHTPTGPVAGRVGTGFSDALRRDLWQNREKYPGWVARVTNLGQYPSGALEKPSFGGWHVEKNIG